MTDQREGSRLRQFGPIFGIRQRRQTPAQSDKPGDKQNTAAAYGSLCHAYLAKPIDKTRLLETLRQLALIK